MAHATVEWTANLDGILDVAGLLELIATAFRDKSGGVFPVGGVRVRAVRITDYVVGDGRTADAAFIDINVKMGVGRSDAFKQAFFDQLFDDVRTSLGDLFDRRPLALSLYVTELEGWKHNTVHRHLAAQS